jgi:hypothetical protein
MNPRIASSVIVSPREKRVDDTSKKNRPGPGPDRRSNPLMANTEPGFARMGFL